MRAEVEEAVAVANVVRAKPVTLKDQVWREVLSWFWVIVAFLLIEGTLVQARVIPSGSMERTVLIGDHLIVSRIGYDAGVPFTDWHVPLWREPKRQQIIVFRAPLPGNPDFIKRVIGLPGDTILVKNGTVYVNGEALDESYIHYPATYTYPFDGQPRQVPDGNYFVLGDNRPNSSDSHLGWFVPVENFIGKAWISYWPPASWGLMPGGSAVYAR